MFDIFRKKSHFLDELGIDKSNWSELFSASLGRAMLLQKRLFKQVVEASKWQADFESGKIYFDKQEFDMQFIGSESFSSNTWLWGYENVNGFDERLLSLANKAREFGEKFGLEAFSTAQFELDEEINGHTISLVACVALGDELSYYKIDYDGGAAYVAFRAEAIFKEPVLAITFFTNGGLINPPPPLIVPSTPAMGKVSIKCNLSSFLATYSKTDSIVLGATRL